ncbi:MAG: hypothetical protein ACSHXY_00045 [Alphaproteobacteria bacterium]
MQYFKTQKVVIILLIGIVAAFAISGAMKPDAGLLKFKVRGETAYGYGTTTTRSLSDFKGFLRDNPQVTTLVLKKMPGTQDSVTNTKIARLIRANGLKTRLEGNSYIASGAVDLFIAGAERTMECGALIGVHSWSMGTDGALIKGPRYHPKNLGVDRFQKFHEDFLSDMGVDPAFYVFTRESALPEDLYVLSAADIEKYGLLTSSGCE